MSKFKLKSTNDIEISEKEMFKILKVFFIKNKQWFVNSIIKISDAELLTVDEVAHLLKVSRTTLYRYEKGGMITPVDINGRTKRFLKSEIMAFTKGGNHD